MIKLKTRDTKTKKKILQNIRFLHPEAAASSSIRKIQCSKKSIEMRRSQFFRDGKKSDFQVFFYHGPRHQVLLLIQSILLPEFNSRYHVTNEMESGIKKFWNYFSSLRCRRFLVCCKCFAVQRRFIEDFVWSWARFFSLLRFVLRISANKCPSIRAKNVFEFPILIKKNFCLLQQCQEIINQLENSALTFKFFHFYAQFVTFENLQSKKKQN